MSETLQIFGEQFTDVTGIKAYKPNGDVVTFTAGASSPFELVTEVTLSEAVRGVTLDTSSVQSNYAVAVLLVDATLSASDWLYISAGSADSTSGYYYTAQSSTFVNVPMALLLNSRYLKKYGYGFIHSNSVMSQFVVNGTVSTIRINTYTASVNINAGSKIKIYGVPR